MANIVTDAEMAARDPNYQEHDDNPTLHLSEDLLAATMEIIKAELGDKTFCLIIIFTISWAMPTGIAHLKTILFM